MNFIKSLLVIGLFTGANAYSMQPKKIINNISPSDIAKVIGYAWENQNTVWTALGKMTLFVYLPTKYLESNSMGAQKIKDTIFEDDSEYRKVKLGAYLATGAYVFRKQIIDAGVNANFYNNFAKVLGLSFFIGKVGSLVYNYLNSKNNSIKDTHITPVAIIKENATDEEKSAYIENLKKYNRTLLTQVDQFRSFVAKIGAPVLNLTNILNVLSDDSKHDDYQTYGQTLLKQKKEYLEHINKHLPIYKAASKINSSTGTTLALASFLSLYALNNFLASAIK